MTTFVNFGSSDQFYIIYYMKRIAFLLFCVALFQAGFAQSYEVVTDNQGKYYKGIISGELIESDTAMKWWAANKSSYTPNAAAVAGIKAQADSIRFMVFMGTWCEDSHFVIPRFFSLLQAAGYPATNVSMIGTDRNKKAPGNLTETFSVKNVPTIIVLKNGRELGRVVEYGSSGLYDKDLSLILQGTK